MDRDAAARCPKGSIRERGNNLQVRYFAGRDPVTGKDVYLNATVKGLDDAARKKADDKLAEFRTQVNKQRSAESSVSLSYAINEWLRTSEVDDSTRKTYVGYIERTIKPVLGRVAVNKLSARTIESFYTELRRCRARCDGKPYFEKHTTKDAHDCVKEKCRPHACKGMAASTVRQIHSILSGTLNAAVRWDWISSSPTQIVRRPKQKPPQPDPPTSAEAARLVDKAFDMDEDWGALVWLVMTTGIRRGELCGLRFNRVDLDAEVIDLRRSWVNGRERTPRPTRTAGSRSTRKPS
ncbi:tyrosine recombinase XerC [Umezawaea endophytica]|uniref:Site-specific integrase n=1 Tax=Umezawaea endophytica TaxID=1654476 RepID=A0A9X3A1N9_9PSEU|nr:site-specific integrase [Umezawaea endophytica]MCS7478198.1 site-specific integrase [Umezawaea endophytica]